MHQHASWLCRSSFRGLARIASIRSYCPACQLLHYILDKLLFQEFSRQLSAFSLCSSCFVSALLALSTTKVSLVPDIILCGWQGLKYQLTNCNSIFGSLPATEINLQRTQNNAAGWFWWDQRQNTVHNCSNIYIGYPFLRELFTNFNTGLSSLRRLITTLPFFNSCQLPAL